MSEIQSMQSHNQATLCIQRIVVGINSREVCYFEHSQCLHLLSSLCSPSPLAVWRIMTSHGTRTVSCALAVSSSCLVSASPLVMTLPTASTASATCMPRNVPPAPPQSVVCAIQQMELQIEITSIEIPHLWWGIACLFEIRVVCHSELKCPYYGLWWKVHILVLGVPNNRLIYMQGQKTLSLFYNMHLFLTYLLNDSQRLPLICCDWSIGLIVISSRM